MPVELANTPTVFQVLVNNVLRDMFNQFFFVYLEHILIFSRNKKDHVTHVRSVLRCFLDNNPFVKAEKWDFHVSRVAFLAYIIAKDSLKMDSTKVSTVTLWPIETQTTAMVPALHQGIQLDCCP